MRPSMRLPLREALYVCSNCNSEATSRGISPLARQFRRHASSDSPSLLERTRRSLWRDKAPGPEDPYRGASQLEHDLMSKEREARKLEDEDEVDQTYPHEAYSPYYVPAETWDGLRRIGHTKDQERLKEASERLEKEKKYSRYGADMITQPILIAVHQAAVEIALIKLLNRPLLSICEVRKHPGSIQQMINQCGFDVSQKEWSAALRFPNQEAIDALTFAFTQLNKPGKIKENEEIEEIESPESRIAEPETLGLESTRALSLLLVDYDAKFAFFKRFSQLLGRRIPDQAINEPTTIRELIVTLSSNIKEKKTNVSANLAKRREKGTLPPNIQFSSRRLRPGDKDEDLGRKKAIHTELFNRGLAILKEEKKKKIEDSEDWRLLNTEV